MKKVLIVSPHFPPVNAPDMHRVRHSLPYFKDQGYIPIVLTINPSSVESSLDEMLMQTIPSDVAIHRVKAFPVDISRKFGVGNLGLRAFIPLYIKGIELIKKEKVDLIYFSTTMFACLPLGKLWSQKFKIPFIVDMQDPWKNDYYLSIPKSQRPPKYRLAHRLNSMLEGYTIPNIHGLISVSQGYVDTLKSRYPKIKSIPTKVLTFGAANRDFNILSNLDIASEIVFDKNRIHIVYVGRGGNDMAASATTLFQSFSELIQQDSHFKKCHFWFIGTSYAVKGEGEKSIEPIATNLGLKKYVTEITDRLPYFEVLSLLKKADVVLILGSADKNYTASKLCSNILAKKPLLCIFHSNSGGSKILSDLKSGELVLFDKPNSSEDCLSKLSSIIGNLPFEPQTDWDKFQAYTAREMTKAQCVIFDEVIKNYHS